MSDDRHDDPATTARALGEHHHHESGDPSPHDAVRQVAALYRDNLRAQDVLGLGAEGRAEIAHWAAQRSRRPLWPWLVAAALTGALVVAFGLYLTVIQPTQQRVLTAEREAAAERRAREHAEALRSQLEGRIVHEDVPTPDRGLPSSEGLPRSTRP